MTLDESLCPQYARTEATAQIGGGKPCGISDEGPVQQACGGGAVWDLDAAGGCMSGGSGAAVVVVAAGRSGVSRGWRAAAAASGARGVSSGSGAAAGRPGARVVAAGRSGVSRGSRAAAASGARGVLSGSGAAAGRPRARAAGRRGAGRTARAPGPGVPELSGVSQGEDVATTRGSLARVVRYPLDPDTFGAMQIKVTIEVTGERAQVSQFLAAASRLLQDDPGMTGENGAWWTEDRAAAFVRALKPPALHALRIIASGAPKIGIQYVQREMKLAGLPMTPGRLSSIGFAVRRLGSPAPFIRDHYQRAYLMDTEVAEVLLPAIDEESRRRRQLRDRPRTEHAGPE
jgi:hypothetical protein